jgi:hypothetical protein
MWDLYPTAHQSTGEEEKRTTPSDSVERVACAPLLLRGGGKRRAPLEFGGGEAHGRGDRVAVCEDVFGISRLRYFFAKRGTVGVDSLTCCGKVTGDFPSPGCHLFFIPRLESFTFFRNSFSLY